MPKKYVHKSRGKVLTYDRKNLETAVEEVKNGSLSIRKAAQKHGVPKSSISDIINNKYASPGHVGRRTALPSIVEDKLASALCVAAKQGIGVSRRQLHVFRRVGAICKKLKVTPFKNPEPSKDWWQGLKKRFPKLTIRTAEKLTTVRASMLNVHVVDKYFEELGELLKKLNLEGKPNNIWNCDETAKSFKHNPIRVIAEKGSRNVVGRTTENRTSVTILACVNAEGKTMSPLMIAKGKTSKSLHGFNTEAAPKGTKFAFQKNGWMNDEIGEVWFREIFLAECGSERPQLLILDGHSSHETLSIIEMAMAENIYVLCLPPHTTHALQPLDRAVFGPFSSAYNQECSDYLGENILNKVTKWSFPGLVCKAWDHALTPSNIKSGFRSCGIYPYDPSVVTSDILSPSIPTDTPIASKSCFTMVNSPSELADSNNQDKPVGDNVTQSELGVQIPNISVMHGSEIIVETVVHDIPPLQVASIDENAENLLGSPLQIEHINTSSTISSLSAISLPPASDPPVIEDPEILLNLLQTGQCELFSGPENNESLWNSEIDNLFLPPQPLQTDKKVNKRKNTSHRLLMSETVLHEKRNLAMKKEKKEQEKQERELKKKLKKETETKNKSKTENKEN